MRYIVRGLALAAVLWTVAACAEEPQTRAELNEELMAALRHVAELGATYGDRHPLMLEQKALIEEIEAKMPEAVEAQAEPEPDPYTPRAPDGRLWWLGVETAQAQEPPE